MGAGTCAVGPIFNTVFRRVPGGCAATGRRGRRMARWIGVGFMCVRAAIAAACPLA
jgi:hypothetical protein